MNRYVFELSLQGSDQRHCLSLDADNVRSAWLGFHASAVMLGVKNQVTSASLASSWRVK